MDMEEELRQIRQEMVGLERNVGRLFRRLNEIESRGIQTAPEGAEKAETTPAADAPARKGEAPAGPSFVEPSSTRPAATPPPLPPTFSAKPPEPSLAASSASVSREDTAACATNAAVARIEKSLEQTQQAAARPKRGRKFGPPEDMSFEMALGSYWLPRIGMLLVAIATAWGFTYVSQQFKEAVWMPYVRVALGYSLSAILLGIGWWLEKKHTNYARLLMGGGLGIVYFVTFATWYIPQTRIAPSQEFTLVLLGLLVAGWGGLAHWRQSQLLAFSMTALGHFTVALSTLSLDTPSNTAVGGLILLGLGSAWFMQRNGWHLVAMAAMIGSYLNQFFWLSRSPGTDSTHLTIGMAVLVAYLVIYAVAERLTPIARIKVKRRERNLFVAINTAGFVVVGLALIRSFPYPNPFDYQLYFGTAVFTGCMGLSYLRRKPKDKLAAIYFVKTSVLVAVGLATWLDGSALTFSLSLEALVLLLMARYNREHSSRLLALGAAVLTALHAGYTIKFGQMDGYGAPGFEGEALVAIAVTVVFGLLGEVYRVTPWDQYPATTMFPSLGNLWVWLEMAPAEPSAPQRPSRIKLSQFLIGLGALVVLGYIHALSPEFAIPATVSWMALAVLGIGLWRRSAPLLFGGVFLSMAGVLWWFEQLVEIDSRLGGSLVPLLICVAPLLIAAELLRIAVPVRMKDFALLGGLQGAWHRKLPMITNGYGLAAAALTILSVNEGIPPENILILCGGLGLIGTLYASQTKGANIGLFALCVMVHMPVSVMMLRGDAYEIWKPILGIAMLGCAATGVESRWWGSRLGLEFHRLVPVPYLFYGIFAWCAAIFALREMTLEYDVSALLVLAGVLAGLMPWLHARAMAIHCTILCTLACMIWLVGMPPQGDADWWKMSAFYLVGVTLCSDRWIARYRVFDKPVMGWILQGLAWVTLCQSNRILASGLWGSGGLALIGIVFLTYGIVFRQRIALVLSLASGVLATTALVFAWTRGASVDVIALNYGAVIAYWVATERVTSLALSRTGVKLDEGQQSKIAAVLTGTIAILGLMCLAQIETIHDFYLTISWTVWALVLFGWALVTGQPWFRYVALGTIGVVLGRAFLIDVWQLKGLYRVGAMLFLGLALLGVAYGYTKWRAAQGEKEGEEEL